MGSQDGDRKAGNRLFLEFKGKVYIVKISPGLMLPALSCDYSLIQAGKVQRWLEPRAFCGLLCQHSSPVPEVTG